MRCCASVKGEFTVMHVDLGVFVFLACGNAKIYLFYPLFCYNQGFY